MPNRLRAGSLLPLADLRHRASLSQRELAAMTGISKYSIGQLERGDRRVVSPATAAALEQALGCDLSEMGLAVRITNGPPSGQGSKGKRLADTRAIVRGAVLMEPQDPWASCPKCGSRWLMFAEDEQRCVTCGKWHIVRADRGRR